MDLYVATHNAHKLREIGEILPGFTIHSEDPGVEETATDFAGNALIKAVALAASAASASRASSLSRPISPNETFSATVQAYFPKS